MGFIKRGGDWAKEATAAIETGLKAHERDTALFELATRSRWRPGRDDPDSFVPGDVAVLRYMMNVNYWEYFARIAPRLSAMDPERAENTYGDVVTVRGLQQAPAYFVDSGALANLIDMKPPAPDDFEEVILPWPIVAAFFEEPIRFTDRPPAGGEAGAPDLFTQMARRRGSLIGLACYQEPGGGLADMYAGFFSIDPDGQAPPPEDLDRNYAACGGKRSGAAICDLIANVAALIVWATWSEPNSWSLPDPADRKAFRSTTNTSKFRKAEPRGEVAGVRLFDVGGIGPAAGGGRKASHTSPVGHLRRGHLKRVRVGPRSGWHYEIRRIRPTVVHGRDGVPPVRVGLLPSLEELARGSRG